MNAIWLLLGGLGVLLVSLTLGFYTAWRGSSFSNRQTIFLLTMLVAGCALSAYPWPALSEADRERWEFVDGDFSGENLRGRNFENRFLFRADFTSANLTDATLRHANFTKSNLTGATLVRADASGANFSDAALQNANLSRANLEGATLDGANLTGAKLACVKVACRALEAAVGLTGEQLAAAGCGAEPSGSSTCHAAESIEKLYERVAALERDRRRFRQHLKRDGHIDGGVTQPKEQVHQTDPVLRKRIEALETAIGGLKDLEELPSIKRDVPENQKALFERVKELQNKLRALSDELG